MKAIRLTAPALTVSVLMALGSCTRHNGDIGPWFGTWKLDNITVDGNNDSGYDGNIFWKFQSDIVCMTVVNDATHTRTEHWGTWSEDDNTLTLSYTYSDDSTPAGTGRYIPPAATHIPGGVSQLRIVRLKGDGMQLRRDGDDGTVYTYYLTKW